MLLNSSGTAFMISTSFGALARQYLLDACSPKEHSRRVHLAILAYYITETEILQERTSRLMAFKLTSLPSFTPRCSSATISVMARTRAYTASENVSTTLQ